MCTIWSTLSRALYERTAGQSRSSAVAFTSEGKGGAMQSYARMTVPVPYKILVWAMFVFLSCLPLGCRTRPPTGHSFYYATMLLNNSVRLSPTSDLVLTLVRIDEWHRSCLFRISDQNRNHSSNCWIAEGDTFASCPVPGIQGIRLFKIAASSAILSAYIPSGGDFVPSAPWGRGVQD